MDTTCTTPARTAVGVVYPAARQITVTARCPDVAPERLTDSRSALAWLQAEHQVLLAAIAAAADGGFDDHAWQLPAVLREYFARRGHYGDWANSERSLAARAVSGTTLRRLLRCGAWRGPDPAGLLAGCP